MPDRFKNKYRIDSARLQNWNYAWNAAYFITICTKDRQWFFGSIDNAKMNLSSAGVIADICWHEIKNHARNVELGEFVVMPNHIHGIVILNGNDSEYGDDNINVETRHALSLLPRQQQRPQQSSPQPKNQTPIETPKTIGQQRFQNQGKNTISSIIGGYKSAVTKHANRLGFDFAWQSRFYDHIIRDEKSFHNISEYIMNNALNWSEDKFYR